MPLFFLAGGAAGAYGWHSGSSWGTWLFKRAQRLCRPVFWYLAAWSIGIVVTYYVLGADSAASIGRECVALLWFLGVYLVVLAFVPALTRMSTGRAVAVMVGVADRRLRGIRRDPIRGRRTDGGRRELRHRLADPDGDRGGLRTTPDRRAHGARRRRIRIRRAARARGRRTLRGLSGCHWDRTHLERVAADAVARAALHLDVVRVRRRSRARFGAGLSVRASGTSSRQATRER